MSAALVAGILQRNDLLATALGLLLVVVCVRQVGRSGAALIVLLLLSVFAYGKRDTVSYEARCALIDSIGVSVDGAIVCDGFVSGYPVWSPGGLEFEFDAILIGCHQRLRVKANTFDLAFGDRLRLFLKLDPASKTRRSDYLRGRGLTGSARAARGGVQVLNGEDGHVITRQVLWPVHDYVRRTMSRGCGAHAGVPMALLLGERGYLDRRTRDAFSTLGISHLLALSGFHLGFVAATLLGLLRLLRVRSRAAVIICLILYVGIVGFILSLYRALTMVMLLVLAARLRRPLRPVHALANAFFVMLLLFPFALYSLGFQLSFMATLAVLLCVERMRPLAGGSRVRKWLHGMWTTLWVSGFVQLWVAPILLTSFGGISIVAPVATVLFVAPVVITLALSAAAAILATLPFGVGAGVFECLGWVTALFEGALRIGVAYSPSPAELPVPAGALFYGGMWAAIRGGKLWITVVGVLATAAAFVIPWFSS